MTLGRAARWNLGAVALAVALVVGVVVLRGALTSDPLERLVRTADGDRLSYQGSWQLPRGGPYVLGFESPGPAELAIDGRVVVRGIGQRSERVVYPAGPHAVRLVAPAGARLVWKAVGRRGSLEYVSASSLSPEPPERARFDGPGTAPLDGALAAAALLVVVALLGFLARGWLRRLDRATALALAAVLGLALAVRLIDLDGAGPTWDEDTNWTAGRDYVTNLLALDFSGPSWRWNLEHPPVSKYLYGIGAQLADGYGPARATAALLMALACAVLVPIGRRLGSLRAGGLAGLIAALSPHLIAHGKVVGHEAPTALAWAVAVWLCLVAHDALPEPAAAARRALVVRFSAIGVVLGLAVSVRFVNGLLAPLIGALLLIGAPAAARRRTLALGAAVVPLVAVLVAIAVWPRLWSAPLEHLAEAWAILKRPHGTEPFLGTITNQPGPHYFPLYLIATAPLGVLLGLALFGVRAAWRRDRGSLVVGLFLLAPLLVAASPVRQDGVRYLIPSLFALALAAGLGLDWALDRGLGALARRAPRRLTAAAAALVALYLGLTCVRIHPYYLDYYGEQVGGPATVAARRWFETAWWGEGLDRAIDYLNQVAPEGAKVHKACVAPDHLAWMRADLWPEVRSLAAADFVLVYAPLTRGCKVPAGAALVFEVAAQGAPLAQVFRVPR